MEQKGRVAELTEMASLRLGAAGPDVTARVVREYEGNPNARVQTSGCWCGESRDGILDASNMACRRRLVA